MHPFHASVVVLALAGTTFADPVREAYRGVRAWTGTVTVTVDDRESASGITTTMTGSLHATFGPLPIDRAASTPSTPVWAARNVKGTMKLATSARSSGSVRAGARDSAIDSVMSWEGSGPISAAAEVRIVLDFDSGAYELHLYTDAIAGTYTADAMGHRETRPDRVSIGGLTRKFPLPPTVGRIEQRFRCSFVDCYVHGIPATPHKAAIEVAIVLEPVTGEPRFDRELAAVGGPATQGCGCATDAGAVSLLAALAIGGLIRRRRSCSVAPTRW